jgi:hypothetical protein
MHRGRGRRRGRFQISEFGPNTNWSAAVSERPEGAFQTASTLKGQLLNLSYFDPRELDRGKSHSWLRQGLVLIFKNAQSIAFSRHLEKPLILQCKFKEKVARPDRKK